MVSLDFIRDWRKIKNMTEQTHFEGKHLKKYKKDETKPISHRKRVGHPKKSETKQNHIDRPGIKYDGTKPFCERK